MTDKDLINNLKGIRIAGYALLSKRGRDLYTKKCRELLEEGELRRSYLQSLIMWADNYDRYWKLRSDIEKEGETFQTLNRNKETVYSANPKVKMMNDALKQANNILNEFGSTLKQARKLGKEKKTADPLDGWTD